MRLIVITEALPYGVGEAFLVPELRALHDHGHDVTLIPAIVNSPSARDGVDDLVARTIRFPSQFRLLVVALGLILARPIRAVHALYMLTWNQSAKNVARNLRDFPKGCWIALVVEHRDTEHIHAYWATRPASIALVASTFSSVPWSFTAHRYDIVENNALGRKASRAQFARFISTSGVLLARQIIGSPVAGRPSVLHLGVKIPPLPSNTAIPIKERPLIIMCPANLVPVKGHIYLLDAIRLLQGQGVHVHLLLAGDGPLRAALQSQAAKAGLTNVRFLGQLTHGELLQRYRDGEVDAVVLPSIDLGGGLHEGIPVALVEAMAHNIAVISTRTGGIPELLDGGAGLVVEPGSSESLAKAIACLATDAALRLRLAAAGRRQVELNHDVDKIASTLIRLMKIGEADA